MVSVENEFMVDSIREETDSIYISGACNKGVIFLDDIFKHAYKHEIEPNGEGYSVVKIFDQRSVELKVTKIIAYGHEINELPEGMTGDLLISGNGIDSIVSGDLIGR